MKIKCINTYGQSNLTLNKIYETDLIKSEVHSFNMMTDLYLIEDDKGETHGYLKENFKEIETSLDENDNIHIFTGNKKLDKIFESGLPIEHIAKLN